MDDIRSRTQDDLRGLITGDVHFDETWRQLYSSDASIFQVEPLGVVLPRHTADVVACVRYAQEHGLSIHVRGAGSGLAGGVLGSGLVLDMSKHFRRILDVGDTTVRVQAGVVLGELNETLRAQGRVFGPDPATAQVRTIGGAIGVDASGSRWLKYGATSRHVKELELVLADGSVVRVGREPIHGVVTSDSPVHDMTLRLAESLGQAAGSLRGHDFSAMPGRTGYRLAGIYDGQSVDWPGLITGSEGTLAIVTEATLSTDPLPEHVGVTMLMFEKLELAARAVTELLPLGPTACDLLDRRHISLARDTDPRYERLIPEATEAILLVEHEASDADELKARLLQSVDRVQHERRLAFASRLATTSDEISLYWDLGRHVVQTLHRLRGSVRPVPIVEDVTVPPARLPEFLGLLQEVLKRREVTASLFGHAGHGQLHIRPFVDLARPETVTLLSQLAVELYGAVKDAGGTIGAEHGLGLSRSEFTTAFYPEVEATLRQIKGVLDPHNILNPGKVVSATTQLLERNIRRSRPTVDVENEGMVGASSGGAEPSELVELQLAWSADDAQQAMRDCNGCGNCRTRAVDTRMCPIFRFAPAEEASPRAKANLLRSLLTGDLSGEILASDEFKTVVDTCVNCHMCRLECPAGVDIPKLMLEARGAQVSAGGLDLTDWFFCRIDRVARWSSRLSPMANFVVGNPTARWVMEKVFGVAARRKLPRFARRSFVHEAAERGLDRPTQDDVPKVLLFADTFANYSDTQLAAATAEVLDHNGVSVYVPSWQRDSGMALFSAGALDEARALVEYQLPLLAEAVRQGYHIVSAEPSAALCLRREYPAMVDDEDARLVAENTSDACSYLWRLHRSGNLRLDFSPLKSSVTYHTPCHSKALENGEAARHLLELIPGLRVIADEWGCSGMAGMFGMKRKNFRDSIRAGWKLVDVTRQSSYELGATECSACKLQMEQGTTKPTIHPIKLVALSYGLMPEIASQLVETESELVVS